MSDYRHKQTLTTFINLQYLCDPSNMGLFTDFYVWSGKTLDIYTTLCRKIGAENIWQWISHYMRDYTFENKIHRTTWTKTTVQQTCCDVCTEFTTLWIITRYLILSQCVSVHPSIHVSRGSQGVFLPAHIPQLLLGLIQSAEMVLKLVDTRFY